MDLKGSMMGASISFLFLPAEEVVEHRGYKQS